MMNPPSIVQNTMCYFPATLREHWLSRKEFVPRFYEQLAAGLRTDRLVCWTNTSTGNQRAGLTCPTVLVWDWQEVDSHRQLYYSHHKCWRRYLQDRVSKPCDFDKRNLRYSTKMRNRKIKIENKIKNCSEKWKHSFGIVLPYWSDTHQSMKHWIIELKKRKRRKKLRHQNNEHKILWWASNGKKG